jgi:hypothetical protein
VRLASFVSVRLASFAAVLGLAVLPSAIRAQTSAVVDEGTFMVTQKGSPLGRESFRIKRELAPGGQVYQATAESSLGDKRITTRLGTDSSGVPVSYEAETKQGKDVVQRLQGRGRPGRFSVLMQSFNGESAREYVLNHGALLLDEDVFHHFFFVPLAVQHAELVVIAPRSSQQGRFKLEERGAEGVEIAGRTLEGRHFALIDSAGASRDVWIDAKGRLLKVAIPVRELVALRDDPPR